jgi:hypothetical protein
MVKVENGTSVGKKLALESGSSNTITGESGVQFLVSTEIILFTAAFIPLSLNPSSLLSNGRALFPLPPMVN